MIQTKSGPVKVERLASLDEPWGMTFLPDGRLLLTEKPGRLRTYADGEIAGCQYSAGSARSGRVAWSGMGVPSELSPLLTTGQP